MQEVVVNTWCDRHAIAGERVVGQAFALSLPGHPARELDLCQPCRSDLVDELLELVVARSRPAEAPAPKVVGKGAKAGKAAANTAARMIAVEVPGQLELGAESPVEEVHTCPVCGVTSRSYAGVEQHMRNHHGTSLAKVFGSDCPVCGRSCATVGGHGARAHGTGNLLELIAQAEQLGDPFGVVAQARVAFEAAA